MAQVVQIISRDAEREGAGAGFLYLRADRVAVAIPDLIRLRGLLDFDQLVAGCNDGDIRL